MTAFARGSEWRRWDLHIHSPFSILNNQFGQDFDAYASAVLTKAVERRIAVIGVTDYFSIEGYKAFRTLMGDADRLVRLLGADRAEVAKDILFLPNVELRLREMVHSNKGTARVNFHVIFSDALSPSQIEEDFLHCLRFTHEASPDRPDDERTLTRRNLEELGQKLKEEHEPFRDRSDLMIGASTAVVSHDAVSTLLGRDSRFRNRYLLVLPADEDLSRVKWDGQGHQVRKILVQKSHMLFSSNPSTRGFGLGEGHNSVQSFEREFMSLKPCVHGSDAHDEASLFEPAEDRYCWIKSDPTFEGLRQLLFEPASRVFIGPEPPELDRIRRSAARLVDRLSFARKNAGDPNERWFDGPLELNPGLVAVIGRKGSGKSALADVLGFLGDARNHEDFSFLTPKRFLAPKKRLGDAFEATMTWRSGEEVTKTLSDPVDSSGLERVAYLPQSYLERICTELQDIDGPTPFDEELEAVIFSHVDEAERLGCASLRGLIEHRTAENDARVTALRGSLHEINERIVALRRQLSQESRSQLRDRLEQRRRELASHADVKPKPVPEPTETASSEESRKAATELAALVERIQHLDQEIVEAETKRKQEHQRLAALNRLLERIDNLFATVQRFYAASAEDSALAGVNLTEVVALEVQRTPLLAARDESEARVAELGRSVDKTREGSLANLRAVASAGAAERRAKLDEPARRYEEYQRKLAVWTREHNAIQGSTETPGSIAALEATIEALDSTVRNELVAAIREREDLWRTVLEAKFELLARYAELHAPVHVHVSNHPVAQEIQALSFSTTMALDGLVDGILSFVHQGRKGTFQGEADGRKALRELIAQSDFQSTDGVAKFLTDIGEALTHDLRVEGNPKTDLDKQLRQGVSAVAFYDYLFGLSYLRPRFELRWQGKQLDQLSPGERGTLLLVFFLLIDQRSDPLIVDQPEENLDNETIAELLVPAVKHAKGRRQVVLVTHNPNLAVVCDAEQVVHASIDKGTGNQITYTSGSIENPAMTQRLIDVLEGTKPAFDLRDAKYEVLERGGPGSS
jgi:ABC-type lipoprotein export system ATPase subunit